MRKLITYMFKKCLFLILLITVSRSLAVHAGEPFADISAKSIYTFLKAERAKANVEAEIASTAFARIQTALSLLAVIQGGYDFSCFVKSYVYPNEEEQYHKENIIKYLKVIKAEEELYECLIRNAHEKKNEDGLPISCKEAAKAYETVAGPEALNKTIEEFKCAVKALPAIDQKSDVILNHVASQPKGGMSVTKKVLIGSTITVGIAGAVIVAAPIIFPGTIIAAKATAITAAANSAVAATAAKAVVVTKTVASTIAAMETVDKINNAALAIQCVRLANSALYHSRWYFYPTLIQELQQLIEERVQKKSLTERILEYQKKYQGML